VTVSVGGSIDRSGCRFLSSCVSVLSREKRARRNNRMNKLGQGLWGSRGRTGDGRVRSESWHVFWIGSERLSEME
jgi:hypothetical protein